MSDLPVSERVLPRPVFARYLRRRKRMWLGPPTEEEKSDAILILRDSWLWADVITEEAERIFAEAAE
jgi:hypothetical protein